MADLRLARSREALIAAVTDILDRDDQQPVSITELCTIAGVSRPTFYQHFGDVASVMHAAAIDRLRRLFDDVAPLPAAEDWSQTPRVLRELLHGLGRDGDFYRRVLTGPSALAFHHSVIEFVTARLLTESPLGRGALATTSPEVAALRSEFLAAGASWLIMRWLESDAPTSTISRQAEEITALLRDASAQSADHRTV